MKLQSLSRAAALPDPAIRRLYALGFLFIAFAAVPAFGQQCAPASGGAPCETASGVASLGDPDGSDLTVGNPIHPITGNKYQEEVDAPALPGFLGWKSAGTSIRRTSTPTAPGAEAGQLPMTRASIAAAHRCRSSRPMAGG